jgi:hypothetical protein
MPKWAITIGAYALPDFVSLNLLQCRAIFGGSPALVSDDGSGLGNLAAEHGAYYVSTDSRMSHCSGDWQALVNAAAFGAEMGAEFCLKLSQRLVPAHPDLVGLLDTLLQEHDVVVPCPLNPRVVSRPGAVMYTRFPILSDIVAWRTGALTPERLISAYRDSAGNRASSKGAIVEYALASMLSVSGLRVAKSKDLGGRRPGNPLFLRKSSSNPTEYKALAATHGLQGSFNCSEWREIEGANYRPVAAIV